MYEMVMSFLKKMAGIGRILLIAAGAAVSLIGSGIAVSRYLKV